MAVCSIYLVMSASYYKLYLKYVMSPVCRYCIVPTIDYFFYLQPLPVMVMYTSCLAVMCLIQAKELSLFMMVLKVTM